MRFGGGVEEGGGKKGERIGLTVQWMRQGIGNKCRNVSLGKEGRILLSDYAREKENK